VTSFGTRPKTIRSFCRRLKGSQQKVAAKLKWGCAATHRPKEAVRRKNVINVLVHAVTKDNYSEGGSFWNGIGLGGAGSKDKKLIRIKEIYNVTKEDLPGKKTEP